ALMHVVEEDLGFHLYDAVERCKIGLSVDTAARLAFASGPVNIDVALERAVYEAHIATAVAALGGAVERLLEMTGVAPGDVDRVFLTGGSSRVVAVRRLFAERFGAD